MPFCLFRGRREGERETDGFGIRDYCCFCSFLLPCLFLSLSPSPFPSPLVYYIFERKTCHFHCSLFFSSLPYYYYFLFFSFYWSGLLPSSLHIHTIHIMSSFLPVHSSSSSSTTTTCLSPPLQPSSSPPHNVHHQAWLHTPWHYSGKNTYTHLHIHPPLSSSSTNVWLRM